jgi:predicted amidohydrolase YtcJ
MAAAGLSPSFLVNHVYYWGRVLRDNILGPERAAGLHRINTAVGNGLRVSVHSDYNDSPIHPLLAARTAVLRQTLDDGDVLGPDECVDAATALRAITTDAAWQIHADDRGSLEVGKLADFAILSADPWSSDPATWAEITCEETRLGGTVAWSA